MTQLLGRRSLGPDRRRRLSGALSPALLVDAYREQPHNRRQQSNQRIQRDVPEQVHSQRW